MNEDKIYGPFEMDQRIKVNSTYYAGRMGSLFYTTLRDEKRILGVKCETCSLVFWPPRTTCGRCFSKLEEKDLVEIGPQGTLQTFTHVHYPEPIHPCRAPFAYGIVKLDGADSGIAHFIEAGEKRLAVGMRVEPVFAPERKGNILDILYFKPIE